MIFAIGRITQVLNISPRLLFGWKAYEAWNASSLAMEEMNIPRAMEEFFIVQSSFVQLLARSLGLLPMAYSNSVRLLSTHAI